VTDENGPAAVTAETAETEIEYLTVDAKLLRELGERLVGRPHIALAELVKNSFDADARLVEITFARDRIEVVDDGHGMSRTDLVTRWMRVGTTRKEAERRSPELSRNLTGSKGVGRLSSQVLAGHLELITVGLRDPRLAGRDARHNADRTQLHDGIRAAISWQKAVNSGDLTKVAVQLTPVSDKVRFAGGSVCGTRVILTSLHKRWDAQRFRRLAEQVWHLQPPFDTGDEQDSFVIRLSAKQEQVVEEFARQMRAIFDIWTARITARLHPDDPTVEAHALPSFLDLHRPRLDEGGEDATDVEERADRPEISAFPDRLLDLTVEMRDGSTRKVTYRVPGCRVHDMQYEIRVFTLQNRQPEGVSVSKARSYLDEYGGVGIYDGSFRLPYYGVDQDWLEIEAEHAARRSASRLVPPDLAVPRGMQDLPTNRRVYGAVRVSTTSEAAQAEQAGEPSDEVLALQVTRDRLVDNEAYQQLRVLVRAGLDLYAMEVARTRIIKAKRKRGAPDARAASGTFASVRDAIDQIKDKIPPTTYKDIRDTVSVAVETAAALEESARAHASLLGALATAGIMSLAYEHEVDKQLTSLAALREDLLSVLPHLADDSRDVIERVTNDIEAWLARAQSIRAIFSPLMSEETRTSTKRFSARAIAKDVERNLRALARSTEIDTSAVPPDLKLPTGGYPAWSAILQNLFVNAFNAVLDQPTKLVRVDGGGNDRTGWVRVQDTGVGVDLDGAERLFLPFERGLPPSRERESLALGGTGLGLTIVRMITDELGCTVGFTRPEDPFSTAVTVSWKDAR